MSSWFDRLAERILAVAGVPTWETPDRVVSLPQERQPIPRPQNFSYKVFTDRFDRTVSIDQLDSMIGALPATELDGMRARLRAFRSDPDGWWAQVESQVRSSAARIADIHALEDTAVTVLVDHSGSMRDDGITMAACILELTEQFLGLLGIDDVEVLGFTTTSWKGGRSRQLWLEQGRPPRPGRLCDLLHIVYRTAGAGEQQADPERYLSMLRQGLLYENVDGEALQWAAARLRTVAAGRRILLVLSDGAPNDDSTDSANGGRFLQWHLQEVVEALGDAGDIHLCAIGIGYDVQKSYPNATLAATKTDIGDAVSSTFEQVLGRTPTIGQTSQPPL